MGQHTPGPWERSGATVVWSRGAKQVVAAASRLEPSSGMVEYERVRVGDDDFETVVANARLIEAAPDLLTEVERLRAIVAKLPKCWRFNEGELVQDWPVVPGMVVFYRHPKGEIYPHRVGLNLGETWCNRDSNNQPVRTSVADCANTREAAEAMAAEGGN